MNKGCGRREDTADSEIRQAYTHRRGNSDRLSQGGRGESGESGDGSSELHCDDEVSLRVMEVSVVSEGLSGRGFSKRVVLNYDKSSVDEVLL